MNDAVRNRVQQRLSALRHPVDLIVCGNGDHESQALLNLAWELADACASLRVRAESVPPETEGRVPALVFLDRYGSDPGIRYYGLPDGYQFSALIDCLIDLGTGETALTEESRSLLTALATPTLIQVYFLPSCPHSPRAVRLAQMLALSHPLIQAEAIDAATFPDLANACNVYSVPTTVVNDRVQFDGAVPEQVFVQHVLKGAGIG